MGFEPSRAALSHETATPPLARHHRLCLAVAEGGGQGMQSSCLRRGGRGFLLVPAPDLFASPLAAVAGV
ncbi:hypothetical protein ABZP36_007018 [Zizania latifolia]